MPSIEKSLPLTALYKWALFIVAFFFSFKPQCTTKSVEMAYYFDDLPNLKPLNPQFRQETKKFYSKRLVRT